MKQGPSRNISRPKNGLTAHKVSLEHVSEIGNLQAHVSKARPLYVGRKVEAPKGKTTQHTTGSQGKR